jgi:adenosylcobinamide kinase/adenosylcobinamide-phosphate guanylyltransferase
MKSLAMNAAVTLILGGARSGKSAYAEQIAAASGRPVLYLATATAGDEEMAARIAAHRASRPAAWTTVEAPEDLAGAVAAHAREGDVVLVDCLTLWVSNRLLREIGEAADAVPVATASALEARLCAETDRLLDRGKAMGVGLILVSNEVGMGLVPPFPLGRVYRDALGRVNQTVARRADAVVLMVAGIPVDLRKLAAVVPGSDDRM